MRPLARWTVTTDAGESITTQLFITGVGSLSACNIPAFLALTPFAAR